MSYSLTFNPENSNPSEFTRKCYTAKELGEMMNCCPEQLFNVDIAECTNWFQDDDYMEDMLNVVADEKRMDELIKFILTVQELLTVTTHHPKVCRRVDDNRKFVPYVEDLREKLDAIRVRVLHSREIIAQMEEMRRRWADTMMSAQEYSVSVNASGVPSAREKNETQPPVFTTGAGDVPVEYHLSDLPEDVRNQILLNDDNLYSDYVTTLKGPVKQWIDKHHLQDWNVVRFISRFHGIVAKMCSMNIYGRFLDHIGLGNQENNMKQRKDANDKSAMDRYNNPTNFGGDKHWKLRRDGKEVELLLKDVISRTVA